MKFGCVLKSSTYEHVCEKKVSAKTMFPFNVVVYGSSKEILSCTQFTILSVAFDAQSWWLRTDSHTKEKKIQKRWEKNIIQVQQVLISWEVKYKKKCYFLKLDIKVERDTSVLWGTFYRNKR